MESITKYVIADNSEPKATEHWNYCEKNVFPYITAKKQEEHYKVLIDMFDTPFKLTDDGLKEAEYLMKEEIKNLPETLKAKADFSMGNTASDFYPIQKERLEEFCSRLFEIGMNQRS